MAGTFLIRTQDGKIAEIEAFQRLPQEAIYHQLIDPNQQARGGSPKLL